MLRPLLTFCVPNLNKMPYLRTCIESIQAQTLERWQCVVVDGGSTDGSWEYLKQLASDHRFQIVASDSRDMYSDWSKGLSYVDTEYFYILTSDDQCSPELAKTSLDMLTPFPEISVCHFQTNFIDVAGEVIETYEHYIKKHQALYAQVMGHAHVRSGLCESVLHAVYPSPYLGIHSLLFRSNLLSQLKGFSSQFGIPGDVDWTMRMGLHSDLLYIPITLASMRSWRGQALLLADRWQTFRFVDQLLERNFAAISRGTSLYIDFDEIEHFRKAFAERVFAYELYRYLLRGDIKSALHSLNRTARERDRGYLFRALLSRIQQGNLSSFRIAFARHLIDKYSLLWPPVQVTAEALKHR